MKLTSVLPVPSILLMVLGSIGGSWIIVIMKHAVIGMSLDMLLQILRALEVLSTEGAAMRLEWDVNANMRSNMVAFHHLGTTRSPRTCEAEIVRALAPNMFFAKMFLLP